MSSSGAPSTFTLLCGRPAVWLQNVPSPYTETQSCYTQTPTGSPSPGPAVYSVSLSLMTRGLVGVGPGERPPVSASLTTRDLVGVGPNACPPVSASLTTPGPRGSGILQCPSFRVWFVSLSLPPSAFMHVAAGARISLLVKAE